MGAEKADSWALVQELSQDDYKKRAGASDVVRFFEADKGEVFWKVFEWVTPDVLVREPNYETWAADHGFRIIKDPAVVQNLRSQTKADIGATAWS